MRLLYPNNLKNWEFDKEARQIFCPEQGTVFIDTARGEDEKSGVKPTQSKTNFLSCLGICLPLVAAGLLVSSCESKTGTGALSGGGIGAVGGALITHSAGGALVGAAIGAGAGALIGYALDQEDREIMQKNSPDTLHRIDNRQQLSIDDIKKMSENGLKDETIIAQIQVTHSVFYLSTADIIDLKNSGVSQRVIDAMIESGKSS